MQDSGIKYFPFVSSNLQNLKMIKQITCAYDMTSNIRRTSLFKRKTASEQRGGKKLNINFFGATKSFHDDNRNVKKKKKNYTCCPKIQYSLSAYMIDSLDSHTTKVKIESNLLMSHSAAKSMDKQN